MIIDKYIARIEAHEMAARIAEACMNIERPKGLNGQQTMAMVREQDPAAAAGFYRAALAAGKYLEEAINNYERVQ